MDVYVDISNGSGNAFGDRMKGTPTNSTPTTDSKVIRVEEEWVGGRGTTVQHYVQAEYARKLERALRQMFAMLKDDRNLTARRAACDAARDALEDQMKEEQEW